MNSPIAAIVIGRNEGERLVHCLSALGAGVHPVIYVDSGSIDGSVEAAQRAGAEVIDLDISVPFTAARARNAGLAALGDDAPDMIQFIDGDCELLPGWIAAASSFLEKTPRAAIVCGRLRERFPDVSIYNRLCDLEWDTPIGRTRACGGIFLGRMSAIASVGGFNPTLIAGEEPELCVRLRAAGWEIWRLDAEMALHDAAMTRFDQWWTRARRAGHAAAEGMAMHGSPPERHGVDQVRRALLWGFFLPAAVIAAAAFITPWALLGLLIYPMQVARLAMRDDWSSSFAWFHAVFLTLGKFPEALGVIGYWRTRMMRRPSTLIEYK